MPFHDLNLAENKLLVLYVLETMKLPLSGSQITQIILENSDINYFLLQQYIDELTQNQLMEKSLSQGKSYYTITKQGKETLDLFANRLPKEICDEIRSYIKDHRSTILNESHNIATYQRRGDGEFEIQLKMMENETALIHLSLQVTTHQQAKDITNNWKQHGEKIYPAIIASLIKSYD